MHKLLKFSIPILKISLILVLAISPIIHTYSYVVGGSTDWLTGFQWRKSHVINGSSYGALTDYCVRIDVHRENGTDNGRHVYVGEYCKSDFGDIRFTNASNAELDYFLYNQTSAHAQFWVEIDSIPAYPSNATIYLYFGNSTATTTSNAQASSLYGHGDDFNDQSMNVTLWELYKQSGVSGTAIEDVNGFLNCRSAVGNAVGYVSVNRYVLSDLEISMYVNVQTDWANDLIISSYHDNDYPNPENAGDNYVVKLDNQTDKYLVYRRRSGVKTLRFQQTWNRSTGDNYLRMRITNGDIKFIEGDYERYSESYALSTYNMYFYAFSNVDNTDGAKSNLIDSFFIRKYFEPEPNHFSAWGSMETSADWAYNDFDYRKHLTLVSYEENLTDHALEVITYAGGESLSTHGVIGNDVKGGSSLYPVANSSKASLYTPNASGYINQLSVYVEQSGSDYPNLSVAVYANHWNNTFDYPTRLLAVGNGSWVITAGFDGWRTWGLNKTLDVGPNMEYWLICWQVNSTKTYEGCKYYSDGPITGQTMAGETFPDWPDPWTYYFPYITGTTLSIYANLTSESKDDNKTVYLNNHAQADFDDIRFTWVNTEQLQEPINYWIDPDLLFAGDNATFFVEIPEIYNISVSYCWIYYGNATAGNVSELFFVPYSSTLFYDDFNGSAEPPEGWNETSTGTFLDVTEYSYYRVYDYPASYPPWDVQVIWWEFPTFPDLWRAEARINITDNGNQPCVQGFLEVYHGVTEIAYMCFADAWTNNDGRLQSRITGTTIFTGNIYGTDTYLFEIERNATHFITYYTVGGGSRVLFQEKAETNDVDKIRIKFQGTWAVSASNPDSLVHHVLIEDLVPPEIKTVTYAWSPEGLHSVQVTYYYNAGGVFHVNGTNIVNGSSAELYYLSSVDLGALGNTTMVFNNFTITNMATVNTGLNPYLYNFTSDETTVIWCRWAGVPFRYDLFFGGLMLVACIAGLLGYSARRKRF